MKHSDFHSKLWVYRITWRMVGMNWVCPNMKELQSFLAIFIGSHDVQQRFFFPDTKPDVGMGRMINPWVRGSIGTHHSVRNALLELGLVDGDWTWRRKKRVTMCKKGMNLTKNPTWCFVNYWGVFDFFRTTRLTLAVARSWCSLVYGWQGSRHGSRQRFYIACTTKVAMSWGSLSKTRGVWVTTNPPSPETLPWKAPPECKTSSGGLPNL